MNDLMITINADFMLGCLLCKFERVTPKILNKYKQKIYDVSSGSRVYIDVTRNGIFSAVECNPSLFRFAQSKSISEDYDVVRGEKFEKYSTKWFFNYMGHEIPEDLKKRIKKIFNGKEKKDSK